MDTSHLAEHAGTAGALFASIFVVATTTMRTMIPLRVFGILANVVLIVTAIPTHNFLVMGVQVVMLFVNSYRLHQMLQLVRDVKKSVNSDLSMEWLKPFMTERQCAAGEILFYKDEKAEDMLYIVSGKFKLVEFGHRAAGRRHRRRTRHAVTVEHANPDAGMRGSRPRPERQLQQGRGALRAESGFRLLFPSPLQRAAVSESRDAAAAVEPANGVRCGAEACIEAGSSREWSDRGILSSLRYLFADIIGEDDDTPPFLPEGLPEPVMAAASDAIHLLIDYQGASYAELYVHRLQRFVGKQGVDDAMLTEIARLMAVRMAMKIRSGSRN